MLTLYIANKNYSSWSLRPWVLMKELEIPFDEQLLIFGDETEWGKFREISPRGLVPSLIDGDTIIWDSLAIIEYLAEQHSSVWPQDKDARAWARSASAEMHSGFQALRTQCSMSCGIQVKLKSIGAELSSELERLQALWSDGIERFGGPFLAGNKFTAVDAFYSAIVFRIRTYGLELNAVCDEYAQTILALESMQEWYQAGIQETWRDESHEREIESYGEIISDIRAVD